MFKLTKCTIEFNYTNLILAGLQQLGALDKGLMHYS